MVTVNEESKNKSTILLPPMAGNEKCNIADSQQTHQRRHIKSTLESEFFTTGSLQAPHDDTRSHSIRVEEPIYANKMVSYQNNAG